MRHAEVREGIKVALGPTRGWKPRGGVGRHGPVTWLQAQKASVGSMNMSRFWFTHIGRDISAPRKAAPGATVGPGGYRQDRGCLQSPRDTAQMP